MHMSFRWGDGKASRTRESHEVGGTKGRARSSKRECHDGEER